MLIKGHILFIVYIFFVVSQNQKGNYLQISFIHSPCLFLLIAAPEQPESLEYAKENRSSVAAANSAVFPRREWPQTVAQSRFYTLSSVSA